MTSAEKIYARDMATVAMSILPDDWAAALNEDGVRIIHPSGVGFEVGLEQLTLVSDMLTAAYRAGQANEVSAIAEA